MYLHLGEKVMVLDSQILGIFDIDNTTVMKSTRYYLTLAEKTHRVINVSYELPKSFVVTQENGEIKIYISPISPQTLLKRINKNKVI